MRLYRAGTATGIGQFQVDHLSLRKLPSKEYVHAVEQKEVSPPHFLPLLATCLSGLGQSGTPASRYGESTSRIQRISVQIGPFVAVPMASLPVKVGT
jgi:hypothetical protein